MLTYDLSQAEGPVYQALYQSIKKDIQTGKLKAKEKMPSKRALARNLGISTITVENAYGQLIGEGYLYAVAKSGYFVSDISQTDHVRGILPRKGRLRLPEPDLPAFDFSSNRTDKDTFPFSVWARILRETISCREQELLVMSPAGGVEELREAIAGHLASFRGMAVDPGQIVIGAGTEYLYGLLVQLLGSDKIYCIENPGYKKLQQIYAKQGVVCRFAGLDEKGLLLDELVQTGADVAHVSPTHHFPTGITMPISRRYELLAWANEKEGRYIIEDDYDSEFRTVGKPIPPLQSIDAGGKVIYMNTFSKSLASTIRISYMVLPEELAGRFYQELGFYSCTVSTFLQYTLAGFIRQGYFEKHINRMRSFYGKKRASVLALLQKQLPAESYRVIESESGLHFILELDTEVSDREIQGKLALEKIRIASVTDYHLEENKGESHRFLLNYSSIDLDGLEKALQELCRAAGILAAD